MNSSQIEIQLIAMVVAGACAVPGVFLVLRRMALLSDAISHSILLGIVLGFFLVKDLASPVLVVGAALTGVLTVSMVELLNRTRLVKSDAAIGLVFPVLFSIGVILISRYAGNIHLDTDSVLLGELAFAPFSRFDIGGTDLGPKSLWVMSGVLLINLLFVSLLYKELKLATFDPGLAAALGFSPVLIHYSLMTLVSVTAVGSFEAVGSILVVALMIAPPATAYLLTNRLNWMILLAVLFGMFSAFSGYWIAHFLDASIAGSMATMAGVVFGVVFLLAPDRGLLAQARRRLNQRWEFAQAMLTIHLYQHEDLPEAEFESSYDHLGKHMRWADDFAGTVVAKAQRRNLINREGDLLHLTEQGRKLAREALVR